MSGQDRNLPCWCGSGLKYKRCHLGRELQVAPSLWDARKDLQKLLKTRTCLHPLAGPSTCQGPIVKAHTVRRAADLMLIARKGHVYQVSGDLADLQRTSGRLLPKLVGINEASTFLGFCNLHDTQAFAPLEQVALVPTEEQAFLLAYRPLCKELYLKERQLESTEIARGGDKGRDFPVQLQIQEFIQLMRLGIETSIRDLCRHKTAFDDDLVAGDFSKIRYVAIHLDRVPDLMCSGTVQPTYTFDGRKIQDLAKLNMQLEALSFSLAATDSGGVAVFAWRSDSDTASSQLVDSLLRTPEAEIPDALVRYATSEFENTYYRPEWWEGLSDANRDALLARLQHGVDPETERNPKYLIDDGRRSVDWRVSRISQQRQ